MLAVIAALTTGTPLPESSQALEPLNVIYQTAEDGLADIIKPLNKAQGLKSGYRGLGSIDFRAAARSVLVVGRLKEDPTVRIVAQDKNSLAPEERSVAFQLDGERGFL